MKIDNRWHTSPLNPRTSWKEVPGMVSTEKYMRMQPLTVRITSDKRGMSLSISDERKTRFTIPLEQIADRLSEVLEEQQSYGN